ncbi:unnamed protein product [Peronospora belbahrii]|uniref:RanBP2-type domain-containing protein n=1 Tax=Peronospora belbahrii TaxID=622444 RepID=A0AAU9L258_9STRA|nr:unnamed protein product [Peronospora belbahrii]
MTGTTETNADFVATERDMSESLKMANVTPKVSDTVESMVTTKNEMERQEEEETVVEEPCFNLFGPAGAVFSSLATNSKVNDIHETKSQDESTQEVNADKSVAVVSSSLQYSDVIPASKVHVEELAIGQKLASAGLDLSDSEEEEKELPVQLRKRNKRENLCEEKWVCQICTDLNALTALECSRCSSKRFIDALRESDTGTGSHLRWACPICTNLNPSTLTECLMCLSTRKMGTEQPDSFTHRTWACSLCTTLNDPDITRCEVCDHLRETGTKHPAEKGRECPVCTNINSPKSTRCEICETYLPADETPENQFVDLSFSPPAYSANYAGDRDNRKNSYADLPQYKNCNAFDEAAVPDVIEEISDHECSISMTNPRPLQVRPDLTKFEHFVCVEDLRGDNDCRINYNKMFAGQRSGKSYADRIATRQRQSRKRKQDAARKEAGKSLSSQGGTAARGSNKRKAAAAKRRGCEKVLRTKRTRKTGVSARPASSKTPSPAINHYDDSATNLGEDLSTMAWEGVGSAGYI